MKIAVIVVRTLMGLMFLFASIVVLFKLAPQPELKGATKLYMDGMNATGYFIPLLKITELTCGLAFVSGFFVPLATVVIFPITLNILFYHSFLDPEGLPVAIPLMLANLFLAYACRNHYKTLLSPKIT
jgi:putative oxidoreductase